uniref:Uncharacterized protein n=1 Tax=Gordonia phage Petito TaxID=3158876 RepID=A0AAU8GQ81_9CAUD
MAEDFEWVCNDCTHNHMHHEGPCHCGCDGVFEQRVTVTRRSVPEDEFNSIFATFADRVAHGCVLQIDSNWRFRFLTTNGTLVIVSMSDIWNEHGHR